MKIIVLMLLACFSVAFWYSGFGKKSGITGKNGKIAECIDFLYNGIIRFFDWMLQSRWNIHLAVLIFLAAMMLLRLIYQGSTRN